MAGGRFVCAGAGCAPPGCGCRRRRTARWPLPPLLAWLRVGLLTPPAVHDPPLPGACRGSGSSEKPGRALGRGCVFCLQCWVHHVNIHACSTSDKRATWDGGVQHCLLATAGICLRAGLAAVLALISWGTEEQFMPATTLMSKQRSKESYVHSQKSPKTAVAACEGLASPWTERMGPAFCHFKELRLPASCAHLHTTV
ncbi:uncharacterized protein LOC135186910 isoform X2 [Pogoniulus pusillus]|uniref:uncharacterized protein LOC135186910 isoform X2 n=1 Tax=Pogoniulus pusillus TaxID=488313 RepID=UPI0030B99BE2